MKDTTLRGDWKDHPAKLIDLNQCSDDGLEELVQEATAILLDRHADEWEREELNRIEDKERDEP